MNVPNSCILLFGKEEDQPSYFTTLQTVDTSIKEKEEFYFEICITVIVTMRK